MNDTVGKRTLRVVAAVIEKEGRYLITQRRAHAVLPNLWEFPGGKVEAGESDADALVRELRGRIGVTAIVGESLGERLHEYDSYQVQLALYRATLPDGATPVAQKVQDFRWVASTEFEDYPMPQADQHTMDLLLGLDV